MKPIPLLSNKKEILVLGKIYTETSKSDLGSYVIFCDFANTSGVNARNSRRLFKIICKYTLEARIKMERKHISITYHKNSMKQKQGP